MEPIAPVPVSAIEEARDRIVGSAIATPLLPLDGVERGEVWIKLECLQPIGSFKIRGAANALALAPPHELAAGVYTASAGNMAQGVAFAAQRLGIGCRVIVPDSAPRTKIDAIEALSGVVVPLPFDEWWQAIREHGHPSESGFFVHPVSDPAVIAGNGTVGLEIADALSDGASADALGDGASTGMLGDGAAVGALSRFDAVVVPYGGGGLSCGIASALADRAPDVPIYAAEVETSAPFAASLKAGEAVSVERTPSFVDGIGGSSVLDEMWPLARGLLAGSKVVSLDAVCDAIRTLVDRAHVVAEGAGGAAVAAALEMAEESGGRVVAVVSGGNIDMDVLARILEGEVP